MCGLLSSRSNRNVNNSELKVIDGKIIEKWQADWFWSAGVVFVQKKVNKWKEVPPST